MAFSTDSVSLRRTLVKCQELQMKIDKLLYGSILSVRNSKSGPGENIK